MLDRLTNFLTRTAAKSPVLFMPALSLPWFVYGFRGANTGSYHPRVLRGLTYAETPQGPQKLDLYLPTGAEPPPGGVLLIHGGGWVTGSRKMTAVWAHLLATHGFVTAAVDYRLLKKAAWPACFEDCHAALAWLRDQGTKYGLDPEKIILLGDSAGAHLAALLALPAYNPENRVRGVAALYGPYDLSSPAPGRWPRMCQELLLGCKMHEDGAKARAQALSPIRFVDAQAPPFLLIHGKIDTIVPAASSRMMAAALERAGVPVELILVDGAEHGLFSVRRIKPGLKEINRLMVDFVKRITA